MPEIGQTLSHFRLMEKIGQGGMGEVYLADDTTLDRKVALKFLPEAFTSDPERMARFEREAKLLASLNHPNIAGIHGLEQADGDRFLVLEYVKGETLQAKLSKGALPLEDALELCRQIAEGLEAAHEKGVIHRDLKPANVMITAEEKVKILDFGLAKALSDDSQSIDSSQSPTLTEAMTRPGVILGTAAYMSPEQARGKPVDMRTDIWAFGVVLFEMLTGRSLFAGDDASQTLAKVIEKLPDFSTLPPNLHPKIIEMLQRCLERERRNRYGSISDARVDIEKVLTDPGGVSVRPINVKKPQASFRTTLLWASVSVVLIAVASVIVWRMKPAPLVEPLRVVRFSHELPENQHLPGLRVSPLAVSPDGSQFAYSTAEGIYLRSIDELKARLIPGSEGESRDPFFSTDGRWIGYWTWTPQDQWIKKIDVNGGEPIPLCRINGIVTGASWQTNHTILYSDFRGIMRISEDGGTPEPLNKPEIIEGAFPQILPDGKSLLYNTSYPTAQMKVMVRSLESENAEELFQGYDAKYTQTGHILYRKFDDDSIYAVPFDLNTHKVTGEHHCVIQGVSHYAVSSAGMLIYVPRTTTPVPIRRSLEWVNRKGVKQPFPVEPEDYRFLKISPDGTRVALTISDGKSANIHVCDIDGGNMKKLTDDDANATFPMWTLDSKQIIFASNQEGSMGIYRIAVDGFGRVDQIIPGPADHHVIPASWSQDGNTLVLLEKNPDSSVYSISLLSMADGDQKTVKIVKNSLTSAQISPNGGLIAYTSAKKGEPRIYVRPFPDVDRGEKEISNGFGIGPLWSPDGGKLFFIKGGSIMAVAVKTDPFNYGEPEEIFQKRVLTTDSILDPLRGGTAWDIHPDGDRFLMIKIENEDARPTAIEIPRTINIVLNWFEEWK